MSRHRWSLTAALVVLAATSGCAGADDSAVTGVAERFYAAVNAGDGATACHLLAPATRSALEQSAQKPCDQAVLEEHIEGLGRADKTSVFGTMAQVRFGEDTAFLARFRSGWRLMALSCSPVADHPYDCEVSG